MVGNVEIGRAGKSLDEFKNHHPEKCRELRYPDLVPSYKENSTKYLLINFIPDLFKFDQF